ncbi:lipocalin family protein [uncultured Sunxiuqinia sp.]|uniref:lipocalin family protein n=1 Tax=uncultured Sunxiuqinia sp. TaxID=1573825 RepID=UPI00262C304F|nr:lipocalin family protein [uncultured Sunxiuqinia sp.]
MNTHIENSSPQIRAGLGILAAAVLLLLSACSNPKDQLIGSWTQSIPGQEPKVQGFELKEDGKASSINMSTLQYKSWSNTDTQLILSGKSIGNGVSFDFTDTLLIQKITADSLILKRGQGQWSYTRQQ